jgi:hypothetical protein
MPTLTDETVLEVKEVASNPTETGIPDTARASMLVIATTVTDSSAVETVKNIPIPPSSHVVSQAFEKRGDDELDLNVGDLIGIEESSTFTDGWAMAQNISRGRERGLVPLSVLQPIKSGPTQTVLGGIMGWLNGGAKRASNVSVAKEAALIPSRSDSL